jgi:hypothetical protein
LHYTMRKLGLLFPNNSLNFSIAVVPPSHTMALGSTQPLTELSTRDRNKTYFGGIQGGRRVKLPTSLLPVSRLFGQGRILSIPQPNRLPRPVTGIALIFILGDVRTSQETRVWASTVYYRDILLLFTCSFRLPRICILRNRSQHLCPSPPRFGLSQS